MTVRPILALLLGVVFLGPMLGPWIELAGEPSAFAVWRESDRLIALLYQSVRLFLLISLVALPWGTAFALVIERGRVRHRTLLRALMLFGLILPVPVTALAWQSALGNWLPRLTLAPGEVVWQPWERGLLPAAWIHAMVGLPWVVAIVGVVLRRTDQALEDEARMAGGGRWVLRAVIGPRLLRAILAAAAWLAVQTSTEIAVTDMVMVRTFAEETYTQLVLGGPGVRGSVALVVPFQLAATLLACGLAWRMHRDPVLAAGDLAEFQASTRGTKWSPFAWGSVLIVLGIPLAALIIRSNAYRLSEWQTIQNILFTEGRCLATSTVTALSTGWLAAAFARRCCWAARRSVVFRMGLAVVCLALATTPGPVLGYGLKSTIGWLVEWETRWIAWDFPPLRSLLYDQPSPLPYAWASALRLFPLACLVLWPTIRTIPRDWVELAEMDGANVWGAVVLPATRDSFMMAAFLVAALAMGEVATAKIANPPFFNVYILRLFDQMHYGSESSVAALALVQWFLSGIVGVIWWTNRTTSSAAATPAPSSSPE